MVEATVHLDESINSSGSVDSSVLPKRDETVEEWKARLISILKAEGRL